MALGLTTGGGTISLLQSSTLSQLGGQTTNLTLPLPSTWNSALVVVIGNKAGLAVTSAPTGWVREATIDQGGVAHIELWAYVGNPGGITVVEFTTPAGVYWGQISEWSNVQQVATGVIDSSGTATATSGTTLTVTTSGNLGTSGDLAIAAWVQTSVSSLATFTSPGGWTRLCDNGVNSQDNHLDAEYLINPGTGATLSAVLTSNLTTISAAGFIVCLKPIPPAATQTNYVKFGSVELKLNTADFALIDPVTVPALGDAVAFSNPTWAGQVTARTLADIVDIASGHKLITIAATNTSAAPGGAAPWNLSDVPNGTTLRAYSSLSVRTARNQDGTITTYGTCIVYDTGLVPGMTITVTSGNLGYSAQSFGITNVTNSFIGANPPSPVYLVELGDPYPTLSALVNQVAAVTPPVVTPVVITPSTTVIMGKFNCTAGIKAMGGGIVTVGTASFTVVGAGHTVQAQGQIDARMEAWDNYIATPRRAVRMVIDGGIYTGSWQELPFGLARATYDGSSASGIAIAAGTYNISWQIDTQEWNQMHIYGGWGQAAVT